MIMKLIYKIIWVVAMLSMTAFLPACSDDDDDNNQEQSGDDSGPSDTPSLYEPGDYPRVSQITVDYEKNSKQVVYRFAYDKLGRIYKLTKQEEDRVSEVIYIFFKDSVAVKTASGIYGGKLNKDGYLSRVKYQNSVGTFEYSENGYLTGCTQGSFDYNMLRNDKHCQTAIYFSGTGMELASYSSFENNANIDFNALISNYAIYEYLLTQDVRLAPFSFFGKRSPFLMSAETYNSRIHYVMSYTVNEENLPVKIVREDESELNNGGKVTYKIVYE